jgi:hypothetical protein
VRYVTHQFAHPETLDRARRWLVQVGFDPSRIEVQHRGIPRLAVAVGPGEAAEVALLIDAAEATDPDGFPSLRMEHAPSQHVYPQYDETGLTVARQPRAASLVVGWRPIDDDREVVQLTTDSNLIEAYVGYGD